jgi:hypothetical protein
VSKLRGVLTEGGLDGGRALTAAFGCYQLDLPDGTWVDVLQAESSVPEAESLLAANDLVKARDAAGFASACRSFVDIGNERNAVGIVSINPVVPAATRAKLVRVEQQRMKLWTSWATPMR